MEPTSAVFALEKICPLHHLHSRLILLPLYQKVHLRSQYTSFFTQFPANAWNLHRTEALWVFDACRCVVLCCVQKKRREMCCPVVMPPPTSNKAFCKGLCKPIIPHLEIIMVHFNSSGRRFAANYLHNCFLFGCSKFADAFLNRDVGGFVILTCYCLAWALAGDATHTLYSWHRFLYYIDTALLCCSVARSFCQN